MANLLTKQKPLFLACFLLAALFTKAQSLYEMKFAGHDGVKYNCLLVFFNESSSYMRIAYQDKEQYNVVHVDYQMENGINGQGKNYSLLRGRNPRFITANKSKAAYNPDYFMWFWDKNNKSGLPYTTDDSTFNTSRYIQVSAYQKLEPTAITETFLRRFYRTDETAFTDMKKMCGISKGNTPVLTDIAANTTLHFVLVANTMDPSIGGSCETDMKNLRIEFRQIAKALKVDYKEYIFADENTFNKAQIKTTLAGLQPGKNDMVFFIYRGHGYRVPGQKDDWPLLDIRTSSYQAISNNTGLSLSEVYNTIKAKGARLNVVMGDCCNNEINVSPVTGNNFLTFQLNNNTDLTKLKKLFINAKGNILSAAARKGEVSWASAQGGLYTLSFMQALHETISYLNKEEPNWDKLVVNTIESARKKSTPGMCQNCTLQNGIKFTNLVF